MSGSDVSVVVREALMEPLRKCRTAKFFRRDPATGLVRCFVVVLFLLRRQCTAIA